VCQSGDQALALGNWEEARASFESINRERELAEAFEGLGLAAWWLDLADLVFESRERAYRLFLAREDRAAAAGVAVWLAWDYWAFRRENAVANGWLQRARRLLDGLPACSERAWLEVREGSLCLLEEADAVRALEMATEGIKVAREARDADLEMLARAVQGLALVVSGAVSVGMGRLDEVNAAVLGGEVKDRVAIGLANCYMISACERVRDYDRAEQWCTRLKAFCAKWGLHPLLAVCRTQYASICLWRGTWLEAERELQSAREELAASRPGMTGEALVLLAELRRRQGRLIEAGEILNQTHASGTALLVRADLALDFKDHRSAAELAARYLRRIPAENRTDRAYGLELLVRALTHLGQWDRAKSTLAELSEIATLVATAPLRASASFAAGSLALAEGKPDTARQHFEDALDLFLRCGAPFEVARSRIGLAGGLMKLGRRDDAVDEAHRAFHLFTELNAQVEAAKAKELLEGLRAAADQESESRSTSPGHQQLSKREVEVLRLVSEGLNNQSIAQRLFLSDHTVHRHLANIFGKLSVNSRTAAVTQAVRKGLLS
jgi:ATP/maltotriose-dependent transcriptional regulator MalT